MAGTLNEKIWKQYEKGLAFNAHLELAEKVQQNERFFIGDQWHGVDINSLPDPTTNILKQIVLYQVASIGADSLTVNVKPLKSHGGNKSLAMAANIVTNEVNDIFDRNDIVSLGREQLRNAAVDGDGCIYSYWDEDALVGMDSDGNPVKGDVKFEVIENTRILFGNPNERRVQKQPYIIVWRRMQVEAAKDAAKDNGASDEVCELIRPDNDDNNSIYDSYVDDNVTVLLRLRRDKETGTIWACETTRDVVIREEWDLGIRLYPITWLPWDYRQDCYHGQALIEGLIPNQKAINKLYALSLVSMMMSAFPKIVYDKTRVTRWTNQVGAQIGVNGNVDNIAKVIEPAQISPQVFQFIDSMITQTQNLTGATAAALGNVRPDNTSAILALQKASTIPSEITKQDYFANIRDQGDICREFMAHYYGVRETDIALKDAGALIDTEALEFSGADPEQLVTVKFNFSELQKIPMMLTLDVGASSMWSEISSTQMLTNLAQWGMINPADMLERLPEGTIPKLRELADKYRSMERQMAQMPTADAEAPTDDTGGGDIVGGRGYRQIQRDINQTL